MGELEVECYFMTETEMPEFLYWHFEGLVSMVIGQDSTTSKWQKDFALTLYLLQSSCNSGYSRRAEVLIGHLRRRPSKHDSAHPKPDCSWCLRLANLGCSEKKKVRHWRVSRAKCIPQCRLSHSA